MVSSWEADGRGSHRPAFRWNAETDTFETVGELRNLEELARYESLVQGLVDDGEVEMEAVRLRVVEFYQGGR